MICKLSYNGMIFQLPVEPTGSQSHLAQGSSSSMNIPGGW